VLKRKQVLAVVGIAVISCLVGTMFNAMATDTGGNPWDKVWATMSEFQTKVDSLNATIAELEARVSELESQPTTGFLSEPAYDSGWVYSDGYIITLNHNLGTNKVFVYLIGRDDSGLISHSGYGNDLQWSSLSTTHIDVFGRYDKKYVRVMIWKISESPT